MQIYSTKVYVGGRPTRPTNGVFVGRNKIFDVGW